MNIINQFYKKKSQDQSQFLPSFLGYGPRGDWGFIITLFFLIIIIISASGLYLYLISTKGESELYNFNTIKKISVDQEKVDMYIKDYQERKAFYDDLVSR